MAFCGNCGAKIDEGMAFCVSCGAPVAAAAQPPPPQPRAVTGAPSSAPTAGTTGMTSNVAGALAYLPVVGFIFLLVDPYRNDRFVRFHAFQSVFLGLAVWLGFTALEVVTSLLSWLTVGLFALISIPLWGLLGLGLFVLWILLVYKAYSNEQFMLPNIGTPAATAAEMPADASNLNGFLCYALGFISAIIFLVSERFKQDKFVRFHAFQALFYSVAWVVVGIGWLIVSAVLFGLTFGLGFGWHLAGLSYAVVRLGLVAGWILLMVKAYNNERFMLPLIGNLAASQAR